MKDLSTLVAILLLFISIPAGLYATIIWAFYGGIVDIIQGIKAPDIDGLAIAWGICKVCFAGPIGWLTFFCGICGASIFAKLGD